MATRKKSTSSTSPELSFEAMLERLEGLVRTLEAGDLALEQSLVAYEEGVGLVRRAQACLDGLDQRLEELLDEGRRAPLAPPEGLRLPSPARAGDEAGEDDEDDVAGEG